MQILETERLSLRELNEDDAAFILRLHHEPDWLRFIGDRGVKTLEDAQKHVSQSFVEMYRRHGFGLWLVERRADHAPLGICGLIKRETLTDIDLGFAFLSAHYRQGYAFEAATATTSYGKTVLGLERIVAVVSPGNEGSIRLLAKLGFCFERMIRLSEQAPEIKLYAARF